MVRFLSMLVLGVTGWTSLLASAAWSQQPRPATPSPSQKGSQPGQRLTPEHPPRFADTTVSEGDELLAAILGPAVLKLDSAELTSMPAGAKPAVLTLEQAYRLTLIRTRAPATERAVGPAEIFNTKALDEQASHLGDGDFDRFRAEFLSSSFRDPAFGFLAVLKHRQAVDSARDQVALARNMHRLYEELIRSETSGVSQLQVNQLDQYLQVAWQGLAGDLTEYRSAVDELKVSLGLPPSTPLVVDERILGPFTTAFIAIDAWQRNPRHLLTELPAMHDRLPRLEDLKIGGRSLDEVVQGTLPEEPFLLTCIEVARAHHPILKDDHAAPDDRNALELRIRRLVRGLILIHKNYELERRRLELALREVDQRFEQIVAPPAGGMKALAQSANVALLTTGVLEAQSRLHRGRMRFVALWLEFKERGLALDRELGTMPYDNWDSFHRSFLPKAGRPAGEGEPSKPNTPRPDSPRPAVSPGV